MAQQLELGSWTSSVSGTARGSEEEAMTEDTLELTRRVGPNLPPKTDYQIGCVGAGLCLSSGKLKNSPS